VSGFPDILPITGSPVQTNGGGFIATTNGGCMDPGNITITDATGRTVTVTLHNLVGSLTRPTTITYPPLTITPSSATLACGQTGTFIISGGVTGATYVAASVSPVLTATVASGALSVKLAATYAASALIGTSGVVNVSDGTSIVPVTITYPATCP
jgi:hypothetical protein